jgi:hypothetical protein
MSSTKSLSSYLMINLLTGSTKISRMSRGGKRMWLLIPIMRPRILRSDLVSFDPLLSQLVILLDARLLQNCAKNTRRFNGTESIVFTMQPLKTRNYQFALTVLVAQVLPYALKNSSNLAPRPSSDSVQVVLCKITSKPVISLLHQALAEKTVILIGLFQKATLLLVIMS